MVMGWVHPWVELGPEFLIQNELGWVELGHTVILHTVVYTVNDCLHAVGYYL